MATVEQYSPDNDQCAFLMSVLQPVSLTGTAAFHGNIFVAGEYFAKSQCQCPGTSPREWIALYLFHYI